MVLATVLAVGSAAGRQPATGARPPSAELLPQSFDNPGWTQLQPQPWSRVVYVSSRQGTDSNSGLSPLEPKATLRAGYEMMRSGHPDWLVLKRGDEWNESFPTWVKGGSSETEMMVIGSYGEGPRPVLNTGSGQGFLSVAEPDALAHLALMDLHFRADRASGTSLDSGVTFLNKWSNVLIENCKIEGFRNNIVIESLNSRPSNIRVRRCVVVDAFTVFWNAQGIYTGSVDGCLIEECVFDHNGWRRGVPGANATIFNHNMYLHGSCTGMVTRGNITARAGATGISQRCAGISENNLVLQNPTGIYLGEGQFVGGSRHAVRNNVVLDARDIDSTNARGFGIWIGGVRHVEVYGNVVAHQRSGSDNVTAINLASDSRSVLMSRNIVYDWTIGSTGLGISAELQRCTGIRITDNVLVQPRGGFLIGYIPNPGTEMGRVFGRNRHATSNPAPHQVYWGTSYEDWEASGYEAYASYGQVEFRDPERDIASYMTSLGLTPTLEAFLARAREQERTNWDPRFTADAVATYIRDGFGVGTRGCAGDFNEDGLVNAIDLVAFQNAAAASDPRADLDLDGAITLTDFALMQGLVAAGCP
ncbi:MAG: right-handed parallel beta-helix repeat-containing protein [Phycisphaeraceae bacterium]|nr:right-handed parallel beta-helix repeat-containing protein [Phycisphaeraceae bacterium]